MHSHHEHIHGSGRHRTNRRALLTAFMITAGVMLLEFIGGLATNSLALLSDAGHMLSDAASLALSLGALYLAARPASPTRTYGFYRFEILAALINGLTLSAIAAIIIWEAYQRLAPPPPVNSGYMMAIAAIGLLANLLSAWVLQRHGDAAGNINVRSAYLHVLGDALGSVGAIAAGLLMYAFGWYAADPVVSVLVSLLILRSAWSVVGDAVHVLLEGTPPSLDWTQIKQSLLAIDGVSEVHDLHIWTITSGKDSLSCHLLIAPQQDSQRILRQALCALEEQFQITHVTIQIEIEAFDHKSCSLTAGQGDAEQ